MNGSPLCWTRRTFIKVSAASTAAIAVEANAVARSLVRLPIQCFVIHTARSRWTTTLIRSALASKFLQIVGVGASGTEGVPAIIAALHQSDSRFSFPVMRVHHAMGSPSIDSILLADESKDAFDLAAEAQAAGKRVFLSRMPSSHPWPWKTLRSEPSDPQLKWYIGLLSAHDRRVEELARELQEDSLGQLEEVTVFSLPSSPMAIEAMNIVRISLAIAPDEVETVIQAFGLPHTLTLRTAKGLTRLRFVSSPILGKTLDCVVFRGTSGSLSLPLYTAKDQDNALPAMLDMFANVNPGNVKVDLNTLAQARSASALLDAAYSGGGP